MGELIKIEKNELAELLEDNSISDNKPFSNDIFLCYVITSSTRDIKNIESIYEDVCIGDRVMLNFDPEKDKTTVTATDMNYCRLGKIDCGRFMIIINLIKADKKLYGIVSDKMPPNMRNSDGYDCTKPECYEHRFKIEVYLED